MTMSVHEARSMRPQEGAEENRCAKEFERLFALHYSSAYSKAYRLMGNMVEAEDLAQEAFVRVWTAFATYDRSRPFEGWIHRILSNLAIDRWRRQSHLSICSLDAEGTGGGQSTRARANSARREAPGSSRPLAVCLADERLQTRPEQAYLRHETAHCVRTALAKMPYYYRNAVVLADVQGYSYEEIARRQGCHVGTVRSRLHRGREMLRRYILDLQQIEETLGVSSMNLPSRKASRSQSPQYAAAK